MLHSLKRGYTALKQFDKMTTLETLKFDNLAIKTLPIDKETRNYVRTVNGACFSRVTPVKVTSPKLISYSEGALELIDLKKPVIDSQEFVDYFSGNKILPGSETAAHCYCGHQFGTFAGQLGDGAAMYLGEVINKQGQRWEIQLKGAGPTPYSRQADGRKVLRSSVREFLCSEAMHYLGVPTTRAGSCITSDTLVERDMFYDGHPKRERCTIVLRIAPTFLRFGSFEIFKTRDPYSGRVGSSVGKKDMMIQMMDYTIRTFYPEIQSSFEEPIQRYKAFFNDVVLKTALLVAKWQSVGFCHGVLNTDNMSILGLTIDYGPYGFLDAYNPDHICNSSDDDGRYTYIRQPEICLWNLKKFAEVLEPILPPSETVPLLNLYGPEFENHYIGLMRKKLGLMNPRPNDSELIQEFLNTMEACGSDFTNSFRLLGTLLFPDLPGHAESKDSLLTKLTNQCLPLAFFKQSPSRHMDERQISILLHLMNTNPGLMEQMGKGASHIQREMKRMESSKRLDNMSESDKREENVKLLGKWLDQYCKRLKEEYTPDFSTDALKKLHDKRVRTMNSHNPKFVLRNYVAQRAIEKAEKGDFSEVKKVMKLLETPYDEHLDYGSGLETCSTSKDSPCQRASDTDVMDLPPAWSFKLKVSCSS